MIVNTCKHYIKKKSVTLMTNLHDQSNQHRLLAQQKLSLCDEQYFIFGVNEAIHSIPMKVSYSIDLSKEFSPEELTLAIDKCIQTSDIFGARIVVEDGRPYMEFSPYQKKDIPVFDFSSREEYQKYCSKAMADKINNRDKLYDIFIFSIAGSFYHIQLCFNHLVFDAISGLLLGEKIQKVLFDKSEEVTWHPYAAYLEKIKHYYDSEKYLHDKVFWEKRFYELSHCQYLFPNVIDIEDSATKSMIIETSKAFKTALFCYCSEANISPHLAIVSVLARIISIKAGCKRFFIEIPIGNRSGNNEKNSLGTYEISPPVIFDLTTTNNIYDIIKSVKKQSIDYYKHKNYDWNTKIYSEPHDKEYGRYIPQFCFSYFCENKKSPVSCATLYYYHSDNDFLPMTLHVSDFIDWQTMTFSYMYWSNYFSDDDIVAIHQEVEAGLTEFFTEKTI